MAGKIAVPGKSRKFAGTKAPHCGCSCEDNARSAHKHMAGDLLPIIPRESELW